MMEKAFEDLMWLSNRLSGILELKDQVKDFSDLQNQTKDMKSSLSSLRDQWDAAKDKQSKLREEMDQAAATFSLEQVKAMEEVKLLVSDAKRQAKDILAKAEAKAKDKIEAAEEYIKEMEVKVLGLQDMISTSENQLKDTQDKHSQLLSDLATLKGKL